MKKFRVVYNKTENSYSVIYTDNIIDVVQLQFDNTIEVYKLHSEGYKFYYKSFFVKRYASDPAGYC